ncbi:hypothetical protein CYY_008267 [Polysphondylium violaceum]|uniref:EGF-like domain-containing protein n=1 Tax=Polysphondylium violaceum TaxID=133409 RepID=A0A8J4V1E7_9MYCE|nr:hypothetical protein CYY_008267 [Polysphondylium violaceum]
MHNVDVSHALKATVIGFIDINYYANTQNKCTGRQIIMQVTEIGSDPITGILPSIGEFAPNPAILIENSTTVVYNVLVTLYSNPAPYFIDVHFTLTVDLNPVTVPLLSTDGQPYYFECILVPHTPTQYEIVQPLKLSTTVSKSTIFDGYFKLDSDFTRGLPDSQCNAVDTSSVSIAICSILYVGNGLYKTSFELKNSYPSDLTSSTHKFTISFLGFTFLFDNPLANTQYQNQAIYLNVQQVQANSWLAGAVFNFNDVQDVMPIISFAFRPLKGNFKSLYLFIASGAQFYFMASKSFILSPSIPSTTTYPQITNSLGQSQTNSWQENTLYYVISSFSTNKTYLFSQVNPLYVNTAYPFGLVSVSGAALPSYKISTMFSPYQNLYSINTGLSWTQNFPITIVGSINTDTIAPLLKSISIIALNTTHSIFSLQVTDNISGVAFIQVYQRSLDKSISLNQQDLVSGTLLDGIFEKILPFQKYSTFYIQISDHAANNVLIDQNALFLTYGVAGLFTEYDLYGLSHLEFKMTNVDVSSGSVTNTLYFNFTLPKGYQRKYTNVQFNPTFPYRNGLQSEYFGKYNTDTQLYEIDFVVPAKTMTSELKYSLFINGVLIQPFLILSKFYSTSRVFITSSNFDQMFPVVTSITASPASLDISAASADISWTLYFSDENFVKKAIVQVVGDFDLEGFNTTVIPTTLETNIQVLITKPLDPNVSCRTQNYYIKYIYTEDSLGNVGETFRDVNSNIHPYYLFDSSATDRIQVTCTRAAGGQTPVLVDVSIKQTFNLTTKIPTAIVNFVVSGTVGPSLPSCYFHSYPMDFLSVKAAIVVKDSIVKMTNYSCTIQLPFKYGPQVGVSIYGIVDSFGQYLGYSTNELPATENQFTNIVNSFKGPLIDSVLRDGTKIGVTGTQLYKGEIFVYVDDSPAVKLASVDIATGIYILAGDFTPPSNPSSSVYVSVYNSDISQESNRLLLIKGIPPVTPSPSPSPPAPCNLNCGEPQGHGKCVNGACICNPPYNGLDCSSKTDNSTVITPDPNKPTVNVTIPGTSSGQTPEFISFIYVYGVRELDNTDTLINNYVFNSDKWILVKEGSSSNEQVTTLQYKYVIDNSLNTTIVSTVQVFAQATNITFGNQQLYMNPSTIKFTFNVTSYPFSKSTNSLQLVMTAALESTEKVACSYKEFVGDQNNSQYLKIQIQDRSLFGRFIKFGMIDGREQVVSNTQLDNVYGGKELSKSTSDQSYIGLNIPYYTKYALLDPDFSVLVEQNTARDQANSICTNKSSKKLTNAQIAGIVIGGVVFLFIIGAVAIYFYTRKSESTFAMKLRKMAH